METLKKAQELFADELYANMVSNILVGSATSPEGFDDCISGVLGSQRLSEIRSSVNAEARDKDQAMVCLFSLGLQPEQLILSTIPVKSVSSQYKFGNIISKSGPFFSGQKKSANF